MASRMKKHVLTKGKDADVKKAIAEFVQETDPDLVQNFTDFTKIAMDRSLEAAYPSILALGRRLRGGGASSPGWRFEAADTGNPWQVAFSATHQDGWGFVYVTRLGIDIPEGRLSEYAPDFDAEKIRAEGVAEGLDEDMIEMDVMTAGFMAEAKAKEKLIANRTLPAGVDPHLCDDVDKVMVVAFRSADGNMGPVDGHLQDYASTLDAIATDGYLSGLVVETRPDFLQENGEPLYKGTVGINLRHNAAAFPSMSVLRDAFDAAGMLDDVMKRGMKVAKRKYEEIAERRSALALAEAAQGSVYQDGGLAGDIASDTCSRLWSIGLTRSLARSTAELRSCLAPLAEHGHTSRESEYECNDGRTCMWIAPQVSPAKILMRTQHGTYCVEITNVPHVEAVADMDRIVLTACRIGDSGLREDAFDLRAIFNSPGLYRSEGFLGSYVIDENGTCSVLIHPRFSDRAIRDLNGITGLIGTVAVCLDEDYGTKAPAP